ncbi:class I SAM-dependent methyltransferase [Micromonospora sp. SH-82]|uniref:class I SAM-dependent methyltransferase n=1 Tax=Micromonospora sp. SH-82 TaxID=3132938 RepID=UPI003EBAC900
MTSDPYDDVRIDSDRDRTEKGRAAEGAAASRDVGDETTAATTVADGGRPRLLGDVLGWFSDVDQVLFDWILTRQDDRGERGDLLEMGVYLGKSAVFLGRYLREGESFTVCDLFESPAPDDDVRSEIAEYLPLATRTAFERNYLSFHSELPRVLQAPTSVVPERVAPQSCRFVHIDASHLYEHVYGDIGAARDALLPDGVVVLDDFRAEHTPGVALATWEAVLTRGLHPICLTPDKFYGTWGDPKPIQEDLVAVLAEREDCVLGLDEAAGHRLLRVRPAAGPDDRG